MKLKTTKSKRRRFHWQSGYRPNSELITRRQKLRESSFKMRFKFFSLLLKGVHLFNMFLLKFWLTYFHFCSLNFSNKKNAIVILLHLLKEALDLQPLILLFYSWMHWNALWIVPPLILKSQGHKSVNWRKMSKRKPTSICFHLYSN